MVENVIIHCGDRDGVFLGVPEFLIFDVPP